MSDVPAKTEQPVRPAATVIMLRDGHAGLEVLLLQRDRSLAFHGGAWVFPGGAVDAADHGGPLESLAPEATLESSRRAAVRETREESGVILDPGELVPFAHWTTPRGAPRRFSTWFFLAPAARDVRVVPDGVEMTAHRWITPLDALAHKAEGQLELPAPTFVSLHQLGVFSVVSHALESVRRQRPFVYVPRPHVLPEGIVSLYPGDAAYDEGPLEREGPRHRLRMLKQGWRYERSP